MSRFNAPRPISALALDLEQIQQPVVADLKAVDRLIEARLQSEVVLVNQIAQHIIYSGGKRLRPMIVLLSARAFGYAGEQHVELAAIVEFIHTATLLHDDVVDGSMLRRGRETANTVFGNEASVLVGDFLYSRSFQMMVDVANMRVMEIMADTTNLIAEGEVLQLLNCHDPDTSEARYLKVIRAKTAKLFEAATRVGAVISGAATRHEGAIAAYGLHLGTAYQLVDDVLDYRGATEEIGKNVGDDLAEGKPTLPLIHAMRNGTREESDVIRAAIEHGGRDAIERVLAAVESTGAIAYTARAAAAEADKALEALSEVPPSPYRDALESLAEFSISRTY
jgi:octaprenyl-diphosphate synthase